MRCPGCSTDMAEPAGVCAVCDMAIEFVCTGCDRRSPTHFAFCAQCGVRLTTLVAVVLNPTERASVSEPAFDPQPTRSLGASEAGRLGGQRRTVTTVLSDLSGYTAMGEQLDPEEIALVMGRIKHDAVQIVESFGGIVNQFVGDEIISLFGLPTSSDDDPRRAVEASLALHKSVDELNRTLRPPLSVPLQMHSGIQTGLLIAELQDNRNGVYQLTGDTINTAARLLSVAGRGEVAIGQATLDAVAPYFEIEPAGAHTVRGKAEPLLAFRVLRPRSSKSRFDAARERGLTTFAGREHEVTRLMAAAESTRRSGGHLFVVEGEAGSGKSRLCFEFVTGLRSTDPDFAIVKGRCQAYGSMISYLPFIQVIRETVGIDEGQPLEMVTDTVTRFVEEIDPELGDYVPAYLHLLSARSVTDLPLPWQNETLPERLQRSIVAFVLALSRRSPALVQLDDWHWADDASQETLVRLRRALPGTRTMVLVTQRPTDPYGTADPPESISLEPLPESAIGAIIAGCLGASSVDAKLVAKIAERTLGNPFFIEETCAVLRTQNRARIVDGELTLAEDVDDLVLPETVQSVVRRSVDLLESSHSEILRLASVVGREFSEDVLVSLCGAPVAHSLSKLVESGFVEPLPGANSSRYRFHHVTTQEVTYDTLLVRERRRVHQRIADLIEESQTPEDERQLRNVESLAHHFQRAGNSARAIDYLERAADKAAQRRALVEARQQFRAAIEETFRVAQSKEVRMRRAALTLRWARSCIFLPSASQIELLAEARREALEDGNLSTVVHTEYWMAWIQYSIGNQRAAEMGTRELLEKLSTVGDIATESLVQSHLGQVLVIQRRFREAEEMLSDGLRRRLQASIDHGGGRSHLDGRYCYAIAQLAMLNADRGSFVESSQKIAEAVSLAREIGERATEASLMVCHSITAVHEGDWSSVTACVDALADLPDASVSPFVRILATVLGGYARFQSGDTDAGFQAIRRGVTAHEKSEQQLALCLSRSVLADALVRVGQIEAAREMAQAALSLGGIGDCMGEDLAMHVLLQTSSPADEIEANIGSLKAFHLERGSPRAAAMLLLATAKLRLSNREFDAAAQSASEAVERLRSLGMTWFADEAADVQRNAHLMHESTNA